MKRKVLTALALSVLCFVSFAGCGGNSGGTGDENEPDPDRDQTLAENYDFGDPESWAGERLQRADLGDIVCVFGTGAYCSTMASNYNGQPRPAVVFVRDGEARVTTRRETYEDLLARDI